MNVTELLREYNIPNKSYGQHEHARIGWVQIDCPWCNVRDHYRLGINLTHHYCNCWACGSHSLISVLTEITRKPAKTFQTVLGSLVRERGDPPERGKLVVPGSVGPLLPQHRRYLKGRGFDPEKLKKLWGIQGIGIASRLSWRIFIPVIYHGEVVSWTTRSISNDVNLRYISAKPEEEKLRRSSLLFGEDYCRHSVIIVEGPLDAMKIGPGAVATMGLSYSRAQLLKMSKYSLRIVCLDSDREAQKRARKLCKTLEVFPGETLNVVLNSKDPGEATKREIKKLRELLQ